MPNHATERSHLSQIPRYAGALNIFIGLLAMLSWHLHWQKFLQLIPNTAPMQFNTALCFATCGLSLIFLTIPRIRITPYLGALVTTFCLLSLIQYGGLDFHIDLLFFTPFFEAATTYPGRMSPLSAICFMLVGLGIFLSAKNWHWKHRLEITGLLMCVVGIIALVALIGFAFGIVSAYGWGAYSSLALNTSVLFLVLSMGLLVFAAHKAHQNNTMFVRWLPVTGSVTLLVMIAIVAAEDVHRLEVATYWRKHTIQTIAQAQTFENDLIDLQRSMRSYITLGDTNALATFRQNIAVNHKALIDLFSLTSDNPPQQKNLKDLQASLDNLLGYDEKLIGLYEQKGSKNVFNIETDKEARNYFGKTHDLVKTFTSVEHELLEQRDVFETEQFHDTERLLIFGSGLAATLLLIANFLAGHELAQRRRAEAQLELQAEALKQSNTELEQFAYVASHDMREPLRSVTGFAQILKMQCGKALDEESKATIGRIIDGAKRMSNIIDDLLELSSITSKKKPFQQTLLEQPLQLALENLAAAIKEKNVIVKHDALPQVMIDSSQISLLFQNLIGNAIKFCPKDRTPVVEIRSKSVNAQDWRISVSDNGIGIDPKYFEKIFGIFQRLHSRDEYAGTGIGLAICKKIVERHGGQLWLESQLGNGTTFFFTLTGRQPELYGE